MVQFYSIVSRILTETNVSNSINKSNVDHTVLFEAVNLILVWGFTGPAQLKDAAMQLLGKCIGVREPNIRYLGLMTMAKLAKLEGSSDGVKKHQVTVLVSLKDADISVCLTPSTSSLSCATREAVANFIEERRLILSLRKKDEIERVYAFGSYVGMLRSLPDPRFYSRLIVEIKAT